MTQEEKINVAELLKDCPKGMELDCTIWDNVVFNHIDTKSDYPIYIKKMSGELECLTEDGHFNFNLGAKCVIFPKGKTTWEGFVPPFSFKDGDIVATTNGLFIGIVKVKNNMPVGAYCSIDNAEDFRINNDYVFDRLATTWEKAKLFQAIKDNGYKWDEETKTLEKLVEPKFKVGDKVKRKDADYTYIVTIAKLDDDYYDYVNEDGQCGVIHISTQDDWELVPNKFDVTTLKPFESKVLVRDTVKEIWKPDFFGCLCDGDYCPYMVVGGIRWKCCIPFEGNEHLLGKTNDCNEYYKNW